MTRDESPGRWLGVSKLFSVWLICSKHLGNTHKRWFYSLASFECGLFVYLKREKERTSAIETLIFLARMNR